MDWHFIFQSPCHFINISIHKILIFSIFCFHTLLMHNDNKCNGKECAILVLPNMGPSSGVLESESGDPAPLASPFPFGIPKPAPVANAPRLRALIRVPLAVPDSPTSEEPLVPGALPEKVRPLGAPVQLKIVIV
jgi:hypothetical protein